MLKDKLTKFKANDGFTIIEVIIVLVIAAIIMLAVFLVVPQLQSSQRNTRRQQYARQLLTAVNQWYANNAAAPTAANLTAIAGTQQDPSTPNTDYTITGLTTTATAPTATSALGTIVVRTGSSQCTSGTFAAGSGYAVMIRVEGGTSLYCVSDAQ